VYLNGGPQNKKDAGLQPDGTYYFQVTDPSGATLLSADNIACREVVVSGGRITGVPSPKPAGCPTGLHPLGTFDSSNGEMPVELCPSTPSPRTDNLSAGTPDFDAHNWCDTTPNNGGEYKAWVIPVASYDPSKCASNFGFCDSSSKTDNFKVKKTSVAYISVCKFNDLNGNGVQDNDEPYIPNWPITATGVDLLSGSSGIGTVTVQTGTDGCASFSVSDFTTAKGLVTVTEKLLTGSWQQTAPVVGTYAASDGVIPADQGTVAVTVSKSGALQNTQSLTVSGGDSVSLADFGNTCLDSSCGGNSVELTVTADANPSLTRAYTWGITKSVDSPMVDSTGGGSSSPANYTVTVTHDNGTDSGWQVSGTIKASNPSWVDVSAVDITDVVDNGGACTVTNGSALTTPAKSSVNVPYTCTYSALPAGGTDTATATWNASGTPASTAAGTAKFNFGTPAIKAVDGSATVTDKLDSNSQSSLGTASYTDPSPITYTYSHTFTDPVGGCTSHANTATFTTNTTPVTSSASTTVQNCTIQPLKLACAATSTGEVNVPFSSQMTASGGVEPYTYAIATGSLPAGLSLNASTGLISGTPTAVGSFTVKATDSKGTVATTTCAITIVSGPSLACSAVTSGEAGVVFNSPAMTVTGGTAPYVFSVVGTLPAGLLLNASTGAIAGTPTASGTFSIQVKDANGAVATTTCAITINGALSVSCAAISTGTVGVAFDSGPMTVTGGTPTYTYLVVGTLPAGLTLNASTGAISGTPTASGTFSIKVTDANGATSTSCVITINPGCTDTVTLSFSNTVWTYPGEANITACVTSGNNAAPTGNIDMYDGQNKLATVPLQGGGCAYWHITPGLSAGAHTITARYSGSASSCGGVSAATTINVAKAPTAIEASCWNSPYAYGANYQCNANTDAGPKSGYMIYVYDGGKPVVLLLDSNGAATPWSIDLPPVGTHHLIISYPEQGNYLGQTLPDQVFVVTPAPVIVALTPSSWYLNAGTSLSFTAVVNSWSAGSPKATGSVSFYDGNTLLSAVLVDASGTAVYSTSGLAAGTHNITATYAGGTNYDKGSTTITINMVAAPPQFSDPGGNYTSAQTVALASATPGATIFYTTNGTAPTTASAKYTAPIKVTSTATIAAMAVAKGYANSPVATAKYSITLVAATPIFSLAAGTYKTAQTVTLSDSTAGATIYYTTNGSTPSASSTRYTSPIKVSATETLEAIAVVSGYTSSAVASARYTITPVAATPVFALGAGTYKGKQTVAISDVTAGATIFYTVNGTTPTATSTKYTGAITVSATETINAIAIANGYSNSLVGAVKYTIK